MTELTYIQKGDYFYPNLTVGEQKTPPLGKYGRM
ncbi:MAG: TnpV protein, partial [Oscillospiraceae bacterium]|nr:TnpV protein [Oscillospiraceae bacterium]